MTNTVMAFGFSPSSTTTAYLNATSIPTTLGNITSGASGSASAWANGNPTPADRDVVRTSTIWVNDAITSRKFSVEFRIGGNGATWYTPAQAGNRCVYIDTNCTTTHNSGVSSYTVGIAVRLKRNSTDTYAKIPGGTLIATVRLGCVP